MTEAFITPALVRWARERHRLTTDAAAQRINVKPERLDAWEKGALRPTLRQAQILAQKLHIPFGYLFLSVPPVEKLPLPDLRIVANEPPRDPSPEFSDLLSDVLRKQQWYREYQESEGAERVAFIGRYSLDDSPDIIAADVRSTLSIDDAMRQEAANWEQFLRKFISLAGDASILVLRSGVVENDSHRKLSVQEFRGFAISDDFAPLVFVNGRDAKSAQIFTLAHEIAHLWIGESGVSNPDYRRPSSQQNNRVERLCNRVAAEILLPKDDFMSRWRERDSVEANLQALAVRHRVSEMVVLRQAYDLQKISSEVYRASYERLLEKQRERETHKGEDGGGDFYATLLARSSSPLTTALIIAVAEGRVLHRDAARLLNVKVNTLNGIAERLIGSKLSGG